MGQQQQETEAVGNNMEKTPMDMSKLTPEDLDVLDDMYKLVQFPIFDYEKLAEFPPFKLEANSERTAKFMDMAWKLWNDGNELLQYEIPERFRPYSELEKEFSKELAEARKYYEKSNGNYIVAVEAYSKDNPGIEVTDADRY
jgi:hypothetical protein